MEPVARISSCSERNWRRKAADWIEPDYSQSRSEASEDSQTIEENVEILSGNPSPASELIGPKPNLMGQANDKKNHMKTQLRVQRARHKNAPSKFDWVRKALLIVASVFACSLVISQCDISGKLFAQAQASFSSPPLHLASSSSILKRDLSSIPATQEAPSEQRRSSSNVCQVNDGESVAIVEIEESRGSDTSQPTNPPKLPILGSGQDIELKIESETSKYFRIQDKELRLIRPLNRDGLLKENSTQMVQQPINSIYLQISCLDKRPAGGQQPAQRGAPPRKVIIPVLVKVLDLNDNAPKFAAPSISVSLSELTPIDSIVLSGEQSPIQAIDLDSANNGLIEYSLVAGERSRKWPEAPQPATVGLIHRSETTVKAAPTTTTAEPTTRATSPKMTINLDSEPILNGPMEDAEAEEESDESLLAAAMAKESASTSTSEALTTSASPISPQGRRRRSLPTTLAAPATKNSLNSQQPETRPLTTAVAAPGIGPNTQQGTLWTNLMPSLELDEDQSQGGYSSGARYSKLSAPDEDSLEYFSLEMLPNSNNKPVIRLKKQLDYESRRVHVLNLMATDRASERSERLSSVLTIVVRVLDGDDQGPAFVLDQTGCATGSLPPVTTASPLLRKSLKRRQALGGEEAPNKAMGPKEFKVTEENFDFGDMPSDEFSGPYENGNEDSLEQSLNSNSRTRRIAGNVSGPTSGRRQFQATQASAPPATRSNQYQMNSYSCLSASPMFGNNNGQAEYYSSIMSDESDHLLKILPQQIRARDRDELNAQIKYSFVNGTPANYSHYFQINPFDASIKQIAPINRNQIQRFVLFVQAQEQTANKLFNVAKLTIDVMAPDKNPPVLKPNSYSGFVEENSPIGTSVYIDPIQRDHSNLMKIEIVDEDLIKSPSNGDSLQALAGANQLMSYEFETTSDSFKVNKDGYVYVNKWPLDRDLIAGNSHQQQFAALYMFQVTARQIGLTSSKSVSSPISINITLIDLNDNPPIISNSSLVPIHMPATNQPSAQRSLGFIKAEDRDLPENSRMFFSIHHVSNNGKERFKIDLISGELEAIGKFVAGEQFSLTIQVSDEMSRSSQGILEIFVVPGPNTGGPQFIINQQQAQQGNEHQQTPGSQVFQFNDNSRGYSIDVNEGILAHSPLLQVLAVDPENDPISYSIIDGNVNQDFYINSKSGIIFNSNKLDREEVATYHLMVQAKDSGGLISNRPVLINVLDNNDENPTFQQKQYTFSVEEGKANQVIGQLLATDNDANENGQISYYLNDLENLENLNAQGRALFSIDESSGQLSVLEALDYEKSKSYLLLVTAKDHGENPRSTSASVIVRVIDVQDERPYFERNFLEARLMENRGSFKIAQVQARDPDSVAQVSYVIKSGNTNLFSVDPQSGLVTTNPKGLDYEESKHHTLLIGTIENDEQDSNLAQFGSSLQAGNSIEKSALCRIDVHVLDVNDNAPYFVGQPLPIRIQDSVSFGTILTKLMANDLDGSEPNNKINYQLLTQDDSSTFEVGASKQVATSEKCAQSFMIDPQSGSVSIKSDLRRDSQSECLLLVRAHDLAQNVSEQLSSTTSLTIFIDHIAEISPASMIGFADTSFTLELEENTAANTLIKTLPIINKPRVSFPISCEISAGNELNKFYVIINEQRDCELRTRDLNIDYEMKQRYSLTLKLNTIGGGNQLKSFAQVNINILDRNDNGPTFKIPSRYNYLTNDKFLAAIASNAPSDSQIIQLRASDLDLSHANNLITYELMHESEPENERFKIDAYDGIIRTSRPVEDIPQTRLPLRLKIIASDNPEEREFALRSSAEVLINLIDDKHRMILVFKDLPTGKVLEAREEILSAIQERTNLIAGLEKAESLKLLRNNSLESDVSGTDFWFYLIEPGSNRIVSSEDPRVKTTLFDTRGQNTLIDVLAQSLSFNLAKVRLPYNLIVKPMNLNSSSASFSRSLGQNFASLLILIALFIAITSAIVVIYQCGFWSNYESQQQQAASIIMNNNEQKFYPPYFNPAFMNTNSTSKHLTATSLDQMNLQSIFANQQQQVPSTDSLMPHLLRQQQQQMSGNNQQQQMDFNDKEYETQMLKMSVLFDDCNSVDEQNLMVNGGVCTNLNYNH